MALLVCGLVGAGLWRCSFHGWTKAKLERLIYSEVPPDCTREQAEAWLDSHGISHTYWAGVDGDRVGSSTMPMLAGLDEEELGGMVRGDVRTEDAAKVDLIFPQRLCVYFFFNKQGRLAGYLVYSFVYSL
jgi:hypothetical protein